MLSRVYAFAAMFMALVLPIAASPVLAQAEMAAEAPAEPPVCGNEPISIARMQWPSAAVLAHIHALVLKEAFACKVQVVAGDLGATTSAMATTGRPMVAPEIWLGRVADLWNAGIKAQRVRPAAPTYTGGAFEAWFVPDYVREAAPELSGAEDIAAHLDVLAGEGGMARFISCPLDWACAVINRNLIAAYGLSDRFEIVEPANRFELDQLISGAVSRKEPFVFYYWQPNAVLAQLDFAALDMGGFDPEAMACLGQRYCADPHPSAFPPEQVMIAVSEDLYLAVPRIAAYFSRASMPLAEMNELLAWQSEQGASAEETAAHFVLARAELWQGWVAP